MSWVKDIVQGAIQPIAGIFTKRQERKKAVQTAQIKLQQATQGNNAQVTFTDQEWEHIAASMQEKTWKDEYVTLSVVSILNIIVIGGLAQAFGYPHILAGIVIAVNTIVEAGVDFGFIMTATILSALGLSVWRSL